MTQPDLQPVALVLSQLLASVDPLGSVEVPVADAVGRVSAVELLSRTQLPRFDNAAMDGVAVRAADTSGASEAHPVRLRLIGVSTAGATEPTPVVERETAARIATGAPLPAGADAVVRVERTTDAGEAVLVHAEVRHGHDVRRRGEDVAEGDVVVRAGTSFGPGQVAAAAGTGHRVVRVVRAPRVAVLLTGDEVAPVGAEELGPTQVRDAVGPAVAGLLRDAGADEVTLHGPVGDDEPLLRKTIEELAAAVDLLVTTGGVSKGPRDLVPGVVASLGEVSGGDVALRPGKPFRYGRVGETTVLCLPGNPAAALVAAEVFARPVVTLLRGGDPTAAAPLAATLSEELTQRPGRTHWIRAVVEEDASGRHVRPAGGQGASMLHSLAAANAWLVVGAECSHLSVGDRVDVVPMWGDGGRAAWRPR